MARKKKGAKKMAICWNKYDRQGNTSEFGINFTEDSMTRSEFAEETEIYNILEKYNMTGQLPPTKASEPIYMDMYNIPNNMKELKEMTEHQEKYFNSLPSSIRTKYDNDMYKFAKEVQEGNFTKKMLEEGLITEIQLKESLRKNAIKNENIINKNDLQNDIKNNNSESD